MSAIGPDAGELQTISYMDYYGVAREVAEAELALTRPVGEFAANVERTAADRFSGLWIEHKPIFHVVVALTDANVADVEALAPIEFRDGLEFRVYEHSLPELIAVAESIDVDVPHNLDINVQANSIRLEVFPGDGDELVQRLPDVVEVVEVPSLGGPAADIYGGTHLTGNGCTAGFAVSHLGTTGLLSARALLKYRRFWIDELSVAGRGDGRKHGCSMAHYP